MGSKLSAKAFVFSDSQVGSMAFEATQSFIHPCNEVGVTDVRLMTCTTSPPPAVSPLAYASTRSRAAWVTQTPDDAQREWALP